jgi:hypothetical protein
LRSLQRVGTTTVSTTFVDPTLRQMREGCGTRRLVVLPTGKPKKEFVAGLL